METYEINWEVSKEDRGLIEAILDRAQGLGLVPNRLLCEMDLTAVHANGCPLRLADMLAGNEADFVHDFAGIARHIDCDTGKLRNLFLPRFAAINGTKEQVTT